MPLKPRNAGKRLDNLIPGAFTLKTHAVVLDIKPEQTGTVVTTQTLIEKHSSGHLSNNVKVIIKMTSG